MADIINMPKLGFDMREGQLIGWKIAPGDQIEPGQIVAEIESDKATVEVEAYTSGTVLELLVSEGDWVPIGDPMAIVGSAGEEYSLAALGISPELEFEAASQTVSVEVAATQQQVPTKTAENGREQSLPGSLRASPLARRMAKDLGVDLNSVHGTGPSGRIVKADVERYEEAAGEVHAAPSVAQPASMGGYMPVTAGPDATVIETPRMRQRIGQRMVQAKQQIPHFYVTTAIDMGKSMTLRKEINAKLESKGVKVSVNDLIVKAAALTLKEFPNVNASYNGDTIVRHGHINVGIAVAIENGLINVVSADADQATLTTLAQRHREMIGRARQGKVKPEDVDGETFAVSNLGPWDVDHFIAIINPPAAAIMALGTAQQVPVVKKDGTLGVGWQMKATLSADHRVTDGAEAAAFMQYFKELLEDPIRLLV